MDRGSFSKCSIELDVSHGKQQMEEMSLQLGMC